MSFGGFKDKRLNVIGGLKLKNGALGIEKALAAGFLREKKNLKPCDLASFVAGPCHTAH